MKRARRDAGERHKKRRSDENIEQEREGDEREKEVKQPANEERARKRIMNAALKMLTMRPLSERLLRERLLAKPWSDANLIDDCIKRLKELKLIDDSLFAQNYASYRVNLKPMGRSRLARELAVKKVSREEIDGALDAVFDEVGEGELIDRAIEKRIRTRGRPTDRAGEKRMFDYLARLGFEYDLIIRRLRALRTSDEED